MKSKKWNENLLKNLDIIALTKFKRIEIKRDYYYDLTNDERVAIIEKMEEIGMSLNNVLIVSEFTSDYENNENLEPYYRIIMKKACDFKYTQQGQDNTVKKAYSNGNFKTIEESRVHIYE